MPLSRSMKDLVRNVQAREQAAKPVGMSKPSPPQPMGTQSMGQPMKQPALMRQGRVRRPMLRY